jgi:hypothetical protein
MESPLILTDPLPRAAFDRPFAFAMGPQRSGTSWLDRYLRSRGDVCMPSDVKEVFFFDRHYERGLNFYQSHFKPVRNHRLVMEISTTSFDAAGAPRRLWEIFGRDVRLLCPLRHPMTRSYSLYRHYMRYGLVSGGLKEACQQNPQILSSSYYSRHLEDWLYQFGDKAIHFVFQEDMEDNLGVFVTGVCNALQIPIMLPSRNVSQKYNSMAAAPFPALARAAQKGATWLRRRQLYPVINAAKALGLKPLVFGTEKPDIAIPIPDNDVNWLNERLSGEIERLERLIGPIPQWNSLPTSS